MDPEAIGLMLLVTTSGRVRGYRGWNGLYFKSLSRKRLSIT